MRDTADVLARTAVLENGLANWPHPRAATSSATTARSASSGATARPASSSLPRRTSTRSSCSQARELTWRAGPHGEEKGPGICHGTAGNGYAFLKTFERTGDELWLERARRFAVHALEQVARRRSALLALHRRHRRRALRRRLPRRTARYPIMDAW